MKLLTSLTILVLSLLATPVFAQDAAPVRTSLSIAQGWPLLIKDGGLTPVPSATFLHVGILVPKIADTEDVSWLISPGTSVSLSAFEPTLRLATGPVFRMNEEGMAAGLSLVYQATPPWQGDEWRHLVGVGASLSYPVTNGIRLGHVAGGSYLIEVEAFSIIFQPAVLSFAIP